LTVDSEGIAIHDKVTFREPTLIGEKTRKGKYIKTNFECWLDKTLNGSLYQLGLSLKTWGVR